MNNRSEPRRADTRVDRDAEVDARMLARRLRKAIGGEVRFDRGSRALYATDASNYRKPPIGVVIPETIEDAVSTVALCREHGVPILARGGGTSLAGQCCNVAVVIDFSKHLREIVSVDRQRCMASVQPGTVLDQLRQRLQREGLTYGPDPATHDHCTFGGMIGNNSCGIHSVLAEFYGPGPRTDQQVIELEVLTYDGVRMRVGATSDEAYARIIAAGGRKAEIYRRMRDLRDRYAPLIRRRYPDIPRRVSGYNLPALLPENGFHVAQALVGSESTLATILEATVALVPALPERQLVILGYPSVYEAGDHVSMIREFEPVGIEGIDARLMEDVRKKHLHDEDIDVFPEGDGWLLVELGGQSAEEARDKAERMVERLAQQRDAPNVTMPGPQGAAKAWEVRESGLGATAFVPGMADTWPGWEDSAVPVERVGSYLRDLRGLLERYDYHGSLYGHFGQGCIHTRIDFDLASSEGIETYRAFTRDAAELVVRHGGSFSGEHGDGRARSDLLPLLFGDELVEAFGELKAIWDPENRMNPGSIVDPRPRTADLRLADYHPREMQTYFAYPDDGGSFAHAAMRCVGVGKCRRMSGGTMCPSYMVTREEQHTTRGRARMLFEMMHGGVIDSGWKSEEVKESLDLCLACKGCKSDCPVSVDMATYKAEFLAHYYKHHRLPRQAYAFGWIHRWARIAGWAPWLANLVGQTGWSSRIVKRLGGVSPHRPLPRFHTPFRRQFRRRKEVRRSDGMLVGPAPSAGGPQRTVVLWPDTFNNYFYPDVLSAAVDVLEAAGCQVMVPRSPLCCGRALYDYGMLDLAKKLWLDTMDALGSHLVNGAVMVGLEPSCVAAFREELPNLYPNSVLARRISRLTFTLGEFLSEQIDYEPPTSTARAIVHSHCHHGAIMGFDAERRLLSRIGLDFSVLESGCCGMAGSFGYEAGKYEISMAAGERVLLPAVRGCDDDTLIIADGFSCRQQIKHGSDREAIHLAEVLQQALNAEQREAQQREAVPTPTPSAKRQEPRPRLAPRSAPREHG